MSTVASWKHAGSRFTVRLTDNDAEELIIQDDEGEANWLTSLTVG